MGSTPGCQRCHLRGFRRCRRATRSGTKSSAYNLNKIALRYSWFAKARNVAYLNTAVHDWLLCLASCGPSPPGYCVVGRAEKRRCRALLAGSAPGSICGAAIAFAAQMIFANVDLRLLVLLLDAGRLLLLLLHADYAVDGADDCDRDRRCPALHRRATEFRRSR